MFELEKFFGRATWHDTYWKAEHSPVIECSAMTYLVRHILPRGAKLAFESWLGEVLDRAGRVAKKPASAKERALAKRALIFHGAARRRTSSLRTAPSTSSKIRRGSPTTCVRSRRRETRS